MRLLLVPVLAGCASLVDGGRKEVRVAVQPEHAKAIVDGAVHDASGAIDLDRGRDHRVLLRKPGYEDREITIATELSPWFWGNFALGPLFFVGMIVDAASGSMHRLHQKELRAELDPIMTEAGEIARRGGAIDDAIAHERLALGELAPLFDVAEEHWVVAVVQGSGNVEPELERAVSDQIRIFLAAREIRVVDRDLDPALAAVIDSLKLESYETTKREECQIPLGAALSATHVLRTSIRRFGATCVTSAELYDLETEVAARAVLERSRCTPEEILYAVDRLTARLIRARREEAQAPTSGRKVGAPATAGPVAARRPESLPAPQ